MRSAGWGSVFTLYCICVYVRNQDVSDDFWDPLMNWPIMDGFQSLRCLLKCVNKLVQSIMLKLGMYGYVWIYRGIYGYVWVYVWQELEG